ncbi:hypothetical protein HPB48_022303 [Haemaphysalis longicornis]|uniref:5'-nucleotidase n=1 Tax=Haemaphysalis longicornis TaxID=44386 RepID=A0A9J6FQW0_HAELO|nr:hypothetical protein HPB48_022303 [Haemaphysalis longicornis]
MVTSKCRSTKLRSPSSFLFALKLDEKQVEFVNFSRSDPVHVDYVSAYGKARFGSSSLHLKILHTNDIHSHMRESDKWGVECRDTLRDRRGCFGGVARIAQKGLGNNEFDDGPQELAPFVREMKKSGVPVLATNVETSRDQIFMGMVLPKSEVLMMSGFKVALLAVVTRDTETIAKPDQQILRGLLPYKTVVKDALKKVAGSTKVLLEANDNVCRFRECNLGNLMADSFLDFFTNRRSKVPHAWSDVSGAVINAGAVRESIRQNSNVTLDDLYRVTKIDNELVLLNMNGSQLHKMFEHAVANFTWWPELNGKFLQVSGFRVDYDLGRPAGWRVAWLKILCANCSVPRYEDVHFRKRYTIVTTSFIADGGDGFQFEKGILRRPAGGKWKVAVHSRELRTWTLKKERPDP